jgi:hypothetical protein|tara:strand:+ start:102 stop:284 length:183 start_codon:yes stop_codon:yes gene_type:complete
MLKKTVYINEDKNEIMYIEKREIKGDYLDTLFKYMCTSTDNDKEEEYMTLKNGKKVKKNV